MSVPKSSKSLAGGVVRAHTALPDYPHLSPELLKELDQLIRDAEGAGRLADDLLEVFERAVIFAEGDLIKEESSRMYFPWQLMKLLRKAGCERIRVHVN